MATAELSRRVETVVGYPPPSELDDLQRREFHEALLEAASFEDLSGKWQAAILKAEQNRPKLRVVTTPPTRCAARSHRCSAIGDPAPVVMQELGHTHPGLALRIYAAAMRRDDDENERLRALIEGGLVTSDHSAVTAEADAYLPGADEFRSASGF